MALVMEPLGGDASWTWQWRPKGYAYRNRQAMTMVEPSSTLMGFGQDGGVMDWMTENKWYLIGGVAVLGAGYYGYRQGWFGGRKHSFGTALNLSGRRPHRRGMRGIVELGSTKCTTPVWKSTKRGRRCVSRCGRLWRFRKSSMCR